MMFDDLFKGIEEENDAPEFDQRKAFKEQMEPLVDKLHHVARDLGIPLATIACISYEERHQMLGKQVQAGILVAAQGRQKDGGVSWMPDMMVVILELMSNPKYIQVLEHVMPVIKMMSEGGMADNVEEIKSTFETNDPEEARNWLRKMLGRNPFKDEDDDDEDE